MWIDRTDILVTPELTAWKDKQDSQVVQWQREVHQTEKEHFLPKMQVRILS